MILTGDLTLYKICPALFIWTAHIERKEEVYPSFKIQIIFIEITENYLWPQRRRKNPDFRLLL